MMYRGKEGQWSWIFHRLTGVGVLLFLFIHILDTMLVGWGPDAYNRVIEMFRNPVFKFAEVGLFGAVLYHSFNGVRIILVDFWPNGTKYHKEMMWAVAALTLGCMGPVTYIMLFQH